MRGICYSSSAVFYYSRQVESRNTGSFFWAHLAATQKRPNFAKIKSTKDRPTNEVWKLHQKGESYFYYLYCATVPMHRYWAKNLSPGSLSLSLLKVVMLGEIQERTVCMLFWAPERMLGVNLIHSYINKQTNLCTFWKQAQWNLLKYICR